MAQVPIINQWREAHPYLVNQRVTVERDLRRLLADQGAPFAICREFVSSVDHLGHLYTGLSQCGNRFRTFMEDVLGEVDPNYRQRAGEVYQMYRCGTVHEFEPKVLENRKGQTLVWLCYQGNRVGQQLNLEGIGQLTVTHLEPVVIVAGRSFSLPVSTNCLLDDLMAAIDRFVMAGPEDERMTAWNRAARELAAPDPFDFTVPESTVTAIEQEIAANNYFAGHYDIIAKYPFVAARPILLYDHDPKDKDSRRCRFCGRSKPEVAFKKVAHAAPEFLGNKAIRSMNECDSCNEFLADNFEDHLSKWSLFARSVSQVKGKEGTPTYKNPSKTLRVETRESGLNIQLTDPALKGKLMKEGGPQKLMIPADGTSPPYVPIRAAKALVKIACSICPPDELGQCRRAIDWLMGRGEIYISQFLVFYGFTPGPISDAASRVILLRRKADTAEPYLWCVVQSTGHRFQFFVPGCPADDNLFGNGQATFPAWHYRIPEFGPGWPFGETKYGRFDWSGTEPVQTSATVTFHVENAVRLSDGKSETSA